MSNASGDDKQLRAEVFLDKDAVQAMGDIDIVSKLRKDITDVTGELPVYKKIADIKIRDTEFEKTTTNKIKRNKIVKD